MPELLHFEIEGSYGGNQDWMRDPWMKLGGCAALAAVDSCIYLSLHKGMEGLCPEWAFPLTIDSYNRFAESMRPYLPPRYRGVNRLSIYVRGFAAYLRQRGCSCLSMEALPMGTELAAAEAALKERINAGFPVPILHLTAKTSAVKEYHWHWFLLNGWREDGDGLYVRAVTYSGREWLPFSDLWNENDRDNGGLILYRDQKPEQPHDIHRTAAAVLCDRAELPTKILALTVEEGEGSGCCELPGGRIHPGESTDAAFQRLLGIRGGKLLALTVHEEAEDCLMTECRLVPADKAKLKDCPERQMRWLSREELHAVSWVPACRELADIIYAEMTDAASFRPKTEE